MFFSPKTKTVLLEEIFSISPKSFPNKIEPSPFWIFSEKVRTTGKEIPETTVALAGLNSVIVTELARVSKLRQKTYWHSQVIAEQEQQSFETFPFRAAIYFLNNGRDTNTSACVQS